jgi:transglutaminase-like putative cysteine protease
MVYNQILFHDLQTDATGKAICCIFSYGIDKMTDDIIEKYLREWTRSLKWQDAVIAIYNRIRDIPYAVVPELNSPVDYINILKLNRGSCTPKHLLLGNMYRRLGLDVLYVVFPYSWAQFEELYPPDLWQRALKMPPVNHLACKVQIDGRYVLVDATIDLPLGKIGLPINTVWDGRSDTCIPVLPTAEEELYHPDEAELMPPPDVDEAAEEFYNLLNKYFEDIRHGKTES